MFLTEIHGHSMSAINSYSVMVETTDSLRSVPLYMSFIYNALGSLHMLLINTRNKEQASLRSTTSVGPDLGCWLKFMVIPCHNHQSHSSL